MRPTSALSKIVRRLREWLRAGVYDPAWMPMQAIPLGRAQTREETK